LEQGDSIAQYGGEFMLGGTNSQLYTGDIDFIDIPTGREGFWELEMTTLQVNGVDIAISAAESFSAIDTGTTLVGGPADLIAAIYEQIPGSAPGTGDLEGYYTYPCNATFNIQLGFGTKGEHNLLTIDPRDLELMQVSSTTCVGAFFEIDLGDPSANPSWICGDTFLKSVYSVYRFDPPSVGFVQLSPLALGMDGAVGQALPSPTTVADPIVATATDLPPPAATMSTSGDGVFGSRPDKTGVGSGAPRAAGASAWACVLALVAVGVAAMF